MWFKNTYFSLINHLANECTTDELQMTESAFIQKILQAKCHVITTVRRKQDYDLSKDSSGKTSITKVGTSLTSNVSQQRITLIAFSIANL